MNVLEMYLNISRKFFLMLGLLNSADPFHTSLFKKRIKEEPKPVLALRSPDSDMKVRWGPKPVLGPLASPDSDMKVRWGCSGGPRIIFTTFCPSRHVDVLMDAGRKKRH